MKRPAPRPQREPTAPEPSAGAFTFRNLGRRLHDLGVLHEDLGNRQVKMASRSEEYKRTGIALDQILDEELALQKLILTMRPKTLADAAVQLGILFAELNHLNGNDLENELRLGRLEESIKIAMRAAAGLTSVVWRAAEIDPWDAGDPCLPDLLAHHCPSHVIETAAEDALV